MKTTEQIKQELKELVIIAFENIKFDKDGIGNISVSNKTFAICKAKRGKDVDIYLIPDIKEYWFGYVRTIDNITQVLVIQKVMNKYEELANFINTNLY